MNAFIAWVRRTFGMAEHATVEAIVKPLTDIHDKLEALAGQSKAAAETAHVNADDARNVAWGFEDKMHDALTAKATIASIIPGGKSPPATPPTGAPSDESYTPPAAQAQPGLAPA